MPETWVQSLGWEDPLEKEMMVHSSILAWRIQRTEEPGGLQPMGSQKESDTTERLSNNLKILYKLRVCLRKFFPLSTRPAQSGPVPIPLALLTAPPLVLTVGAPLTPCSP